MLTSSMGALLSLLRSMHSLVVIETARNGNLTSQKYHLRAFGEESDWIDSVIVLSFGCFDLVTTRRRLSLLFPFSRYIVRMGITLVVSVASCSAPQYHEEEKAEKYSDDRRCCGMTHSCCKYRLCLFADAVVECQTVYRVVTFRVSKSPSSAVRTSNLAFHALVGLLG